MNTRKYERAGRRKAPTKMEEEQTEGRSEMQREEEEEGGRGWWYGRRNERNEMVQDKRIR